MSRGGHSGERGKAPREASLTRPRTRGDCVNGIRPCPFAGCKHHLAHDLKNPNNVRFPLGDDTGTMPETCALDVADRPGGATLEEVGRLLGLTRERIRQCEAKAIRKIARCGLLLEYLPDGAPAYALRRSIDPPMLAALARRV